VHGRARRRRHGLTLAMAMTQRFRHLAIEGPIGAGKTTLARRLAAHFEAEPLLENAQDNPFLARFYEDPRRYALAAQLFFLFERAREQRELVQNDLFARPVVSDFLFDKDALFARLNLDDDEYRLYRTIYADLSMSTPAPDLVIYLRAPVDVLLERIEKRGIGHEKSIDADYLLRLSDAYNRFFHAYDAAPVLIVNNEHLDFVEQGEHLRLLIERIEAMRGPRAYFSKAA
jgi:deoxyadenosine/deoxycytidine kinase